jgi:hypothetical protein
MRKRASFILLLFCSAAVLLAAGCDESDIRYWEWNTITLQDFSTTYSQEAVCGNSSPYKFFINPSDTSNNLLIYIEAGGACWDYASCSGEEGIRGAANPNGIPDDYMDGIAGLMSPFVLRDHPWDSLPTKDWTLVFIPYCTGDVHTGDKVTTYVDPETGESLEWHHNGHKNMMAVLKWMTEGPFDYMFNQIDKLMVTGCSAGGAGSIINYHFIRQELGSRVGQAYLLNDSGPIYPAADAGQQLVDDGTHTYDEYPHSLPLHRTIRDVWGIDEAGILEDLPVPFTSTDFGSLNEMLADYYMGQGDRMAHTQFSMDANYSSYSYERFYPNSIGSPPDMDVIHAYWQEDEQYLMDLYDQTSNLGYFIPYYRPFNESHCTCVLSFDDTDIQGQGIDMKDYINDLLGDRPMSQMRYWEGYNWLDMNRPYWGWGLVELLMEAL